MPELPEVENVRRSLEPWVEGARVVRVALVRRDVVRGHGRPRGAATLRDLLATLRITGILRHGKELAITSEEGPALAAHLGMTGQLRVVAARRRLATRDHVHCTWWLDGPRGRVRLVFRDPRRFGALRPFPSLDALQAHRWSRLGPDALSIPAAELAGRLARTRRGVKAALLDQGVLAGVGNIYADEALHAAGLHPARPADLLSVDEVRVLRRALRRILSAATARGGSTLRDYVDADGMPGAYRQVHLVYGRGGAPCRTCGRELATMHVAQRTSVFCPRCQPLPAARARASSNGVIHTPSSTNPQRARTGAGANGGAPSRRVSQIL